ncbi:MAG: flagellar hook-basal body complex protein [Sulfurimonas sp.]|nr:flagellar hook-basal body complex protein [Sulfurimonas sp.]
MMTQAFYTGISGLKTGQSAIDVVADNIANISTTGFRGYNAEFSSLFENMQNTMSSSVNPSSVGVGVRLQSTSIDLSQGSFALSDRSTDMAIEGDGWFGVINKDENLYTRAGEFTFDQNSDLVTPDGLYALGSMGNNINFETNTLTSILDEVALKNVGEQTKLSFPNTLTYPPIASTNAKFIGNLGTDDEIRTISAAVVDSQSNKNQLKLTFTKSVPQVAPGNQWDVVATTQSLDGTITYDTKNGKAFFGSSGELLSNTLTTINNNGSEVAINLGSGYDGVTVISNIAPSSSSSSSDGTIGGDLIGYDINKNAEVIATFSNGFQSVVGQVAVFHFRNDDGLERASGARFRESSNSGEAIIFKDENGENTIGANVMTYRLETSNVTMETALTELIILQRSFDSNSKSITTADEMMQKALNMDA